MFTRRKGGVTVQSWDGVLPNRYSVGKHLCQTLYDAQPTWTVLNIISDLGREICAFANATGGIILIGVDDTGTVVGVGDHNRLKSQVQSIARSADPPVAVEVESKGDVLSVTIP